MNESPPSSLPALASWPVFGMIIALLVGALVLDALLSSHWTDPFGEPGTWVLIGGMVGAALRGVGAWLTRRDRRGGKTLRRLSLVVWAAAAVGGLASLML